MSTNPDHLDESDEVVDGIFERMLRDEAAADADFAQKFVRGHAVMLAINDPARPKPAASAESGTPIPVRVVDPRPTISGNQDVVTGIDEDGDRLTCYYQEATGTPRVSIMVGSEKSCR